MSDLAWMQAVVERIEAARSGAAPTEPADGTVRHVVFRAGSGWYALPLTAVREVLLPRPPLVRVPGAAPAVRGAMNLRGRVVALVELAALLGAADPEATPRLPSGEPSPAHVVLLAAGGGGLGLLVGAVFGVEPLRSPPGSGGEGPVRGATTSERHGATVTVLDPAGLEARAVALFRTA